MARIVPHDSIFKKAKMFDTGANIFVVVSSLISIALIFIESTQDSIISTLNAFNCVFITLVILFDQIFNYLFFEAGKAKRMDFIDNSYGTNYSGTGSQGYFSNDTINKGLYKMAVNCFENSFFSTQISGKMIASSWIKSVIILIIFVFNAALGEKGIVNLLFQLSLPILLFQQAIKITLFYTRMNSIYEGFQRLFNDFKQSGRIANKDPEVVKIIIDYQTTLSWGAIPLDNRIFNKYNTQLSQKWNDIKSSYQIQ